MNLSIFSDEIGQDLGHALEVAAREFGLSQVELRGMWNKLNWDPGNSAFRDEVPYPEAYEKLPKDRLGHVHCKDAHKDGQGAWEWQAMGRGVIDFVGQFKALHRDGYRGAVVLETHWRGAGTPEESSRQSLAGMKDLLRRAGVRWQ